MRNLIIQLLRFAEKYENQLLFLLPLAAFAFVFRDIIFNGGIFSYFDVATNYLPYYFSEWKSTGVIDQSILAGFPPLVTISAGWFDPVRAFAFHFFDAVDTYRLLDLSYIAIAYAA
ncbi:MAG TPA: hypothetical protein VN701_02115, partial [Candidatus Paceibacterota bacterium]|nr:hypothetical protein [Candidatus Paceibacterota bacterium]